MTQESAAGRKTDIATQVQSMRPQGRIENHLDEQLALMTEAMRGALARADTATRDDDMYGHFRSGEVGYAVRFAKTSAKLIQALAKLNGEFNHNVRVERVAAGRADSQPALVSDPAPKPSRQQIEAGLTKFFELNAVGREEDPWDEPEQTDPPQDGPHDEPRVRAVGDTPLKS
jgi:hypothetical protein